MKKFLSLLLACAMVFSLAACGNNSTPSTSDAPVSESPAVDGVEFLPDNAIDVAQELLGLAGGDAMLTVNGEAVSNEIYLYWLGNMTAYYSYLYSMYGMTLDLDATMDDGSTYGDALKEMAYQNCLLLAVIPSLAEELGVELDADDLTALVEERATTMEEAGGEEEYAANLQAMGISDRNSFELDRKSALYDKVKESYTAQALAAISDADVEAYAAENDILSAKHILLMTTDAETGEDLDEAGKAEVKAKAEDILAQLKDGADFDTLMKEHSEDTGLESYPDGYTFSTGEMVTEFEDATRALEIGGMTDELVESPYGYHIILRLSPVNDETRQDAAEEKFNDLVQEKMDSAQVEFSEKYDSFTAGEYYEKLLAFQEEILADESEDTAADTDGAGDDTAATDGEGTDSEE